MGKCCGGHCMGSQELTVFTAISFDYNTVLKCHYQLVQEYSYQLIVPLNVIGSLMSFVVPTPT